MNFISKNSFELYKIDTTIVISNNLLDHDYKQVTKIIYIAINEQISKYIQNHKIRIIFA